VKKKTIPGIMLPLPVFGGEEHEYCPQFKPPGDHHEGIKQLYIGGKYAVVMGWAYQTEAGADVPGHGKGRAE